MEGYYEDDQEDEEGFTFFFLYFLSILVCDFDGRPASFKSTLRGSMSLGAESTFSQDDLSGARKRTSLSGYKYDGSGNKMATVTYAFMTTEFQNQLEEDCDAGYMVVDMIFSDDDDGGDSDDDNDYYDDSSDWFDIDDDSNDSDSWYYDDSDDDSSDDSDADDDVDIDEVVDENGEPAPLNLRGAGHAAGDDR